MKTFWTIFLTSVVAFPIYVFLGMVLMVGYFTANPGECLTAIGAP